MESRAAARTAMGFAAGIACAVLLQDFSWRAPEAEVGSRVVAKPEYWQRMRPPVAAHERMNRGGQRYVIHIHTRKYHNVFGS